MRKREHAGILPTLQKRFEAKDLTSSVLLANFLGGLFNLDSKIWRTLVLLARRPGQLSKNAVRGIRAPYMRPLQVFLFCNVIYFMLQPFTGSNTLKNSFTSHLVRQPYSGWASEQVDRRLQEFPSAEYEERKEELGGLFEVRMEVVSRGLIILLAPLVAALLGMVTIGHGSSWALRLHFALEAA